MAAYMSNDCKVLCCIRGWWALAVNLSTTTSKKANWYQQNSRLVKCSPSLSHLRYGEVKIEMAYGSLVFYPVRKNLTLST